MASKPRLVNVYIERLHDWYVATSGEVPGLFVAHPEFAKVVSDIPLSIQKTFKLNEGVDVVVREMDNGQKSPSPIPFIAEIRPAA